MSSTLGVTDKITAVLYKDGSGRDGRMDRMERLRAGHTVQQRSHGAREVQPGHPVKSAVRSGKRNKKPSKNPESASVDKVIRKQPQEGKIGSTKMELRAWH